MRKLFFPEEPGGFSTAALNINRKVNFGDGFYPLREIGIQEKEKGEQGVLLEGLIAPLSAESVPLFFRGGLEEMYRNSEVIGFILRSNLQKRILSAGRQEEESRAMALIYEKEREKVDILFGTSHHGSDVWISTNFLQTLGEDLDIRLPERFSDMPKDEKIKAIWAQTTERIGDYRAMYHNGDLRRLDPLERNQIVLAKGVIRVRNLSWMIP